MNQRYDLIGRGYAVHRRADPRIAARILAAIGDARTVVNVGAGTGSYEPPDRVVIAVEPSYVMIEQRSRDAAPVVRARAEALPFPDGSFDVSLAILTVHHWRNVRTGLGELARVARRHVLLTWDPAWPIGTEFWLLRDYFPTLVAPIAALPALPEVLDAFPRADVRAVPVPHDCTDGFMAAYWRRPSAYLDAAVRASISAFTAVSEQALEAGLARLAADLASGAWHERNAAAIELDELDVGYRLVVVDRS